MSSAGPRESLGGPLLVSGPERGVAYPAVGLVGNRRVRNSTLVIALVVGCLHRSQVKSTLAPTRVGIAAIIRALAREKDGVRGSRCSARGAYILRLLCTTGVWSLVSRPVPGPPTCGRAAVAHAGADTMDPIGSPVDASAVRIAVDEGQGLARFGDGWRLSLSLSLRHDHAGR